MQSEYLTTLATEFGKTLTEDELDAMLMDPELRESIALATYGADLLRRCQGQGEGPAG